MRCYICDNEATIFSKRDNTYICDECHTAVGETLAEFDVEDWVSQPNRTTTLKEKYSSLKVNDENTSDLP